MRISRDSIADPKLTFIHWQKSQDFHKEHVKLSSNLNIQPLNLARITPVNIDDIFSEIQRETTTEISIRTCDMKKTSSPSSPSRRLTTTTFIQKKPCPKYQQQTISSHTSFSFLSQLPISSLFPHVSASQKSFGFRKPS
jgi:hypothetical protein